ncbi:hypothetical protein PR048_007296 [Dryococelus australis]|uniref:Uncharacterized protein n=1 Tax=Dryococelus australis TaxID=614101 RepID=A0ABQ9ID67_9NEOP|nr:hypothetical protein PR048_007296 [Dryococelus australis]
MELRRNSRSGETGDPQENPLTSGIVRQDSHMGKGGGGAQHSLARSPEFILAGLDTWWQHSNCGLEARLALRRSEFDPQRVNSRIFACWNRAGRCHLPAVFLAVLPPPGPAFPPLAFRFCSDLSLQDLSLQDLSLQDLSLQDLSLQVLSLQDLSLQDLSLQDLSLQDLSLQDLSLQDLSLQDSGRARLVRNMEPSYRGHCFYSRLTSDLTPNLISVLRV